MVFRGKRGEEFPLYETFELVLAVMAIFAFYNNAVTVGRNTEWEKRYVAADLALTLDTAQAVPGNLLYLYIPPSIVEKGVEKNRLMLSVSLGTKFGGIPGALVGYYLGSTSQPIGIVPIEISPYTIEVADGTVAVSSQITLEGDTQTTQKGATAMQQFVPSQIQTDALLTNPPFLAFTKVGNSIQLSADLEKQEYEQEVSSPLLAAEKAKAIIPATDIALSSAEEIPQGKLFSFNYADNQYDGGIAFVPRQAHQGQAYPAVVFLHGGIGDQPQYFIKRGYYFEQFLDEQISTDAMQPVILIAPHHRAFALDRLWHEDEFDLERLFSIVEAQVQQAGVHIDRNQIALVAHGTATGDSTADRGAYAIIKNKAYQPINAVMVLDGEHNPLTGQHLADALKDTNTIVVSGIAKNRVEASAFEENFLGENQKPCELQSNLFVSCKQHASNRGYSYISANEGASTVNTHVQIVQELVKEWLPRLYPVTRGNVA